MGIIYCVHGGAGSASIIKRTREITGRLVHARPDVAFFPHDTPLITSSWREGAQLMSERGYEDLPTADAAALFESRAPGCSPDQGVTINENLDRYLGRMAESEDGVLLCRAPCLGFLAAHADRPWIANVVAVVREPLAQYTSFMKPERHEDWSHSFGGPCSEGAVDFFAAGWSTFTRDCLEAGVRLIRFHRASEDASGDPLLEQVFDGWIGTRKSRSRLTPALEARLLEATGDLWRRVEADLHAAA